MVQPEYKEQIDKWVDDHTEQMLEDLKTLIRIPSVTGEPKSGMPYGEMPAKAVRAMQDMMERYGFRTTNYENYCVAGDLDAAGEKALDILSHLDVVPVSDNWKKTKPFEPLVEGDRIYGRGTSDDKGPSIAALYALRCVRELGLELKKGVRLLCGSDDLCRPEITRVDRVKPDILAFPVPGDRDELIRKFFHCISLKHGMCRQHHCR